MCISFGRCEVATGHISKSPRFWLAPVTRIDQKQRSEIFQQTDILSHRNKNQRFSPYDRTLLKFPGEKRDIAEKERFTLTGKFKKKAIFPSTRKKFREKNEKNGSSAIFYSKKAVKKKCNSDGHVQLFSCAASLLVIRRHI